MNFPKGAWIRVRVEGDKIGRCKLLHVEGSDPFWSEIHVRFERRYHNLNIHEEGKIRILYRFALESVMLP